MAMADERSKNKRKSTSQGFWELQGKRRVKGLVQIMCNAHGLLSERGLVWLGMGNGLTEETKRKAWHLGGAGRGTTRHAS